MQSSNPVFGRVVGNRPGYAAMDTSVITTAAPAQTLEEIYNAPSASSLQTGRMTIDDVVTRTGLLFAILVTAGGFAWYSNFGTPVMFIGMIGAFILGMVNTFSKRVQPVLVMAYAGLEGLALGLGNGLNGRRTGAHREVLLDVVFFEVVNGGFRHA